MKRNISITTMLMLALAFAVTASGVLFAQNADTAAAIHGRGFIDANGDGINDNARDEDGDGIPNGRDPDFDRKGKGKGYGDSSTKTGTASTTCGRISTTTAS